MTRQRVVRSLRGAQMTNGDGMHETCMTGHGHGDGTDREGVAETGRGGGRQLDGTGGRATGTGLGC